MLFMFLSVLFVRVDVLLHLFISDIPHLLEIFEAEVEAELTEAEILLCMQNAGNLFELSEDHNRGCGTHRAYKSISQRGTD